MPGGSDPRIDAALEAAALNKATMDRYFETIGQQLESELTLLQNIGSDSKVVKVKMPDGSLKQVTRKAQISYGTIVASLNTFAKAISHGSQAGLKLLRVAIVIADFYSRARSPRVSSQSRQRAIDAIMKEYRTAVAMLMYDQAGWTAIEQQSLLQAAQKLAGESGHVVHQQLHNEIRRVVRAQENTQISPEGETEEEPGQNAPLGIGR
jgi:hypothetical protein